MMTLTYSLPHTQEIDSSIVCKDSLKENYVESTQGWVEKTWGDWSQILWRQSPKPGKGMEVLADFAKSENP